MDDLTAWDHELAGAQTAAETDHRKVNLDLAIRRVRQRIDRALDVGNQRQFVELTRLLREYQAQVSRATP